MTKPPRELATEENFEEELYLLANPDVARHVANGGDAWEHFIRHGQREGRHQWTPEAAGWTSTHGERKNRRAAALVEASERKYQRFADVLDASRGAGGAFRFLREDGAFPVAYGGASHTLAEYDAESANPGLGDFVEEVRNNPDRRYLDVGCGRRSRRFDNCLYLDVYPSASADLVIEPACRYPIADGSLDGIGCFAVLEHVTEPWVAAAEFRRMLKPGGVVFIDYPFLVPVHGYPSHYYNATRAGLTRLFDDGFETIRLGTFDNQTPDHAINWQLAGILEAITSPELRAEMMAMSVGALLAEQPGGAFWGRVMAALPDEARQHYAAGNTLIARKL